MGSIALVVGVASATTTEEAETLANRGNQDLGSRSAEPAANRIAKAITGRLLLDLNCITFVSSFKKRIAMGNTCKRKHEVFEDKQSILFDTPCGRISCNYSSKKSSDRTDETLHTWYVETPLRLSDPNVHYLSFIFRRSAEILLRL